MSSRKIEAFLLMFVYLRGVALASRIGEGSGFDKEMAKSFMSPWNETDSTNNLPQSHETTNDRNILPKSVNVREKRSFEFLMGLINNNSRFEVTRVDPELTTEKPPEINEQGVGASEILLELMVRIASHPDQWDRVHTMLQTLDQDLKTSRNVVAQLQNLSQSNNTVEALTHEDNQLNASTVSPNVTRFLNNTIKTEKKLEQARWPDFEEKHSIVKIVNTIHETKSLNNTEKTKVKITKNKSPYPKNFTYHRVTGKPDSTSKNPRAYIAVSVIAPKSSSRETKSDVSEEDLTLENELHQLKPWSHSQNLKDMETIRSKWAVQNQQTKKS